MRKYFWLALALSLQSIAVYAGGIGGGIGPDANPLVLTTTQQRSILKQTLLQANQPRLRVNVGSYVAENAMVALTTPTHDGSGQLMHPAVLYFPGGKWGYKYWMAGTPLPNGTDSEETPNVLVSDDGLAWAVPTGGSNPVVAHRGSATYNADPYLMEDAAGRVWLSYNAIPPEDSSHKIEARYTDDGITWSDPYYPVPSVVGDNAVTPSFAYDPTTGLYHFWSNDTNTGVLRHRTAASPAGPYLAATEEICTTGGFNWGRVWHNYIWQQDGRYWLLAYTTGNASGVHLGTSEDGLAWTIAGSPMLVAGRAGAWDATNLYQAAGVWADGEAGPELRVWYSGLLTPAWHIGYTEARVRLPKRYTTGRTLAAHWPLNGDLLDYAGGGAHLSVTGGGERYVPGRDGGLALQFADWDHFTVGALDVGRGEVGTICFWTRPTSIVGAYRNLFGVRTSWSGVNSFIRLEIYGGGVASEKLHLTCMPVATTTLECYGSTTFVNGVWHHVALVMQEAGHAIYVDGQLESLTYVTGNASASVWLADLPAGTQVALSRPIGNMSHAGQMQDVRLYSSALTQEQVVAAMHGVLPVADGATFTVGAEGTNVINVAVDLLKVGAVAAGPTVVTCYLSDAATGLGLTATGPDGGVVIGTDGVLLATPVAAKIVTILTEADGSFDLDITDSGGAAWYLVVVLPNGRLAVSGIIDFTE